MTKLTEIIDAASESSVSTSDLLRKVQTVAFRLDASSVQEWVRKELIGYKGKDSVPSYRGPLRTPVKGRWMNPVRWIDAELSSIGIEQEFVDGLFHTTIRQSVADLEALASGEHEPNMAWPAEMVVWYDELVESRRGGAGFEYMNLISARQVVPQNIVTGIIDSIRTTALQFALELERVSPEAGEPGGPTTENERVLHVVNNFNTNVYGDGNNVAAGSDIQQKSKVIKGDVGSLIAEAAKLGIQPEGLDELRQAVEADGGAPGERTEGFIAKLRAGGIALASGVTTNIAADGLLQLAGAYFGIPVN